MSNFSIKYPVCSFFLPVYSFWCMDDFSWGNTRQVIGEGSNKKVLINEDEKFDDSRFRSRNSVARLLPLFPSALPLITVPEYEAEV